MMPISPLNRVLLIVCALLLMIFLGLWIVPIDDSWLNPEAIAPVAQVPVAIKESLPIAVTDNLDNRPIFDPTRHAVTAAPVSTAPETPTASLTLAGLIVGGGERVALIRSSDSKDLVSVHEGDTVSNWFVQTINADGVIVTANGVTQDLTFPAHPADGNPGAGMGSGAGAHSY